MRIRLIPAFAATVALTLAACSPAKKKPAKPEDDVPQEVTCCFDPAVEGAPRETKPVDRCPEEQRNPVESCNIGPGDAEPPM
jgi:hypothetical protein